VALLRGRSRRGRSRRGPWFGIRGGVRWGIGLGEDLPGEEQELGGVDPLALPAVAMAQELFELMLEFGVEVELLGERLQQLADEPMGRLEIIGERVVRGDHTPQYVDRCSIVGAKFSESQIAMTGRV
jgi:hypothetical protein